MRRAGRRRFWFWTGPWVLAPIGLSMLVYAGMNNGGKSTDLGVSWTPANVGLPDLHVNGVSIDSVTPATLYAATAGNFG